MFDHLIHMLHKNEIQPGTNIFGYLLYIFFVQSWQDQVTDLCPEGRQRLLFYSSHRKDPPSKGDLTGHCNVISDRDFRQG